MNCAEGQRPSPGRATSVSSRPAPTSFSPPRPAFGLAQPPVGRRRAPGCRTTAPLPLTLAWSASRAGVAPKCRRAKRTKPDYRRDSIPARLKLKVSSRSHLRVSFAICEATYVPPRRLRCWKCLPRPREIVVIRATARRMFRTTCAGSSDPIRGCQWLDFESNTSGECGNLAIRARNSLGRDVRVTSIQSGNYAVSRDRIRSALPEIDSGATGR